MHQVHEVGHEFSRKFPLWSVHPMLSEESSSSIVKNKVNAALRRLPPPRWLVVFLNPTDYGEARYAWWPQGCRTPKGTSSASGMRKMFVAPLVRCCWLLLLSFLILLWLLWLSCFNLVLVYTSFCFLALSCFVLFCDVEQVNFPEFPCRCCIAEFQASYHLKMSTDLASLELLGRRVSTGTGFNALSRKCLFTQFHFMSILIILILR